MTGDEVRFFEAAVNATPSLQVQELPRFWYDLPRVIIGDHDTGIVVWNSEMFSYTNPDYGLYFIHSHGPFSPTVRLAGKP